jgi:hypothetical protein
MRRTALTLFLAAVVGIGAGPAGSLPAVQARQKIVRSFTPAEQRSGRYQYIPFEVPPGTGTLRVSYQYDRANGDNVVDLGLFEPGPLDLGTRAFRGYSGGAKQNIILSPQETTPGYRPGPLPPGQWNLLLGLYKVRDAGVEVTIYIEAEEGPSARALPGFVVPRLKGPGAVASRWYVGALHTHTLHSDGDVAPATLMQQFREAKFDFVAITDHNNTTHQYELVADHRASTLPLWILGEEVTTPGGHASVWGLDGGKWIDFRVSPEDGRIGELVSAAHRFGALFSVNHPASECVGCDWTHEFVDGLDAIEISNGRHGEVERALAIWDRLLQSGRRITGVGSSDWHRAPTPLENAHVRVHASALTQEEILEAIRAGRLIVMSRTRDATPEIVFRSGERTARIGESLELASTGPLRIDVTAPALTGAEVIVVANGMRAATATLDLLGEARVEHSAGPGYVRVELRSVDGQLLAIANPVYLVRP